jgi:hypothetical protein
VGTGLRCRVGHGRRREQPRTGLMGAVMATAPTGFSPLTCHFRTPARYRYLRHRRARRRVVSGVSGPLAGHLGLPVAATRVGLQQHCDVMPGGDPRPRSQAPRTSAQRGGGVSQIVGRQPGGDQRSYGRAAEATIASCESAFAGCCISSVVICPGSQSIVITRTCLAGCSVRRYREQPQRLQDTAGIGPVNDHV